MNANDIIIVQRSEDNSYNQELNVVPEIGKVLSFDSNLNPYLKSVPGGSGTTYKLAYWGDPTTLDDASFLHVDPTNGRLAINKTSPAYTLDVNGDANIAAGNFFRIAGVRTIPSNTCLVSPTFKEGSNNYLNDQMFCSIQDALGAFSGTASNPVTVIVFPGTYNERININSYTHVHFLPGAILKSASTASGVLILALNAVSSSITGNLVVDYDITPLSTVWAYHQQGGNIVFELDKIIGRGHTGVLLDGGAVCDMRVNIVTGQNSVIHNAGGDLRLTANYVDRLKSSVANPINPTVFNADVKYTRKIECVDSQLFRANVQKIDAIYTDEGIICNDGRLEVMGAVCYAPYGQNPAFAAKCTGGVLLLKNVNLKCDTATKPAVRLDGGSIFADTCTFSAPNAAYAVDGVGGMAFYNWNCAGYSTNPALVNPVLSKRISTPIYDAYVDDII